MSLVFVNDTSDSSSNDDIKVIICDFSKLGECYYIAWVQNIAFHKFPDARMMRRTFDVQIPSTLHCNDLLQCKWFKSTWTTNIEDARLHIVIWIFDANHFSIYFCFRSWVTCTCAHLVSNFQCETHNKKSRRKLTKNRRVKSKAGLVTDLYDF